MFLFLFSSSSWKHVIWFQIFYWYCDTIQSDGQWASRRGRPRRVPFPMRPHCSRRDDVKKAVEMVSYYTCLLNGKKAPTQGNDAVAHKAQRMPNGFNSTNSKRRVSLTRCVGRGRYKVDLRTGSTKPTAYYCFFFWYIFNEILLIEVF